MTKITINGQEIEVKEFPVIIESKVYEKEVRTYELVKNDNGCIYLTKKSLQIKT